MDSTPFSRHMIAWSLSLCFVWYSLSIINNLIAKALFDKFQYPLTLTFVQSATLWLLLEIVFLFRSPHDPVSILHGRGLWRRLFPLAAGKFVATVASHIALWRVPVSFVHTIKASLPIFTVTFGRVLLGERQTYPVYISLGVICFGVVSTSLTEVAFDVMGFLFAVVSTMMFSLLHIFSKKQMIESKINQLVLLRMYGRLCTLCFLPVWIIVDGLAILNDESIVGSEKTARFCLLFLLTNGVLSAIQNIVAFSMLSVVTPLTYSVASNMKRIFVIGVSILVFNNPVVFMNFFGSWIAVLGTLLYGRARLQTMNRRPSRHKTPVYAGHHTATPLLLEEGNATSIFSASGGRTPSPANAADLFISPSEIDITNLVSSYSIGSYAVNDSQFAASDEIRSSSRTSNEVSGQNYNGVSQAASRRLVMISDGDTSLASRARLPKRNADRSVNADGVLLGFGGSKVHIV